METNIADMLQTDILSVISKYCDSGIDNATAIGVLEIIKHDIYRSCLQSEDTDGD
jgi:septum formation topological specificity factor MinE